MFAFFNRSRRHVAVLAALAMLASVLVAAPAVAADDPAPNFKAAFDACVDAPSSDFTDVPSGHANAGDIDCIAYYGITKGTSDTTYSPLMSVSREHMALFLTRLAGRVGIEMTDTPDDAGFTDIGDLSEKSQLAINQLADLGITSGTSDTTYSPGDSVRRDHMALFIARLMNKMTPLSDGDDGDDNGDWGYTPSDVADNDRDKDIGSPFTDLGTATKTAFDAITQLYELGIASGISDTAYAPSSLITRAAMAEFMAGVMDHSNLRPAGVSIQATPSSVYGTVNDIDVIVSVRDDSFAPVADQPVDHFNSTADNAGLKRGKCDDGNDVVDGDCEWTDDDDFTSANGNLVLDSTIDNGATRAFYAWIGEESGDTFDDTVVYASTSIVSKKEEMALKATSTISKEADVEFGNQADLDTVKSVTITVQLVDAANADTEDTRGPADNAKAVARAGQEIVVEVAQETDGNGDGNGTSGTAGVPVFSSTNVVTLTTDDDGKVTYTVDAPTDEDDTKDTNLGKNLAAADADPNPADLTELGGLEDRIDSITFVYQNDDNDGELAEALVRTTYTIRWSEINSYTAKAKAVTNPYVIKESDGDAKVRATVTFYDQYGNGHRQGNGQKVGIDFGGEMVTVDGSLTPANPRANVNGNGVARRSTTVESTTAGMPIPITYDPNPDEGATRDPVVPDPVVLDITVTLPAADDQQMIQVVTEADIDDNGVREIHTLFADDDEFTTEMVNVEAEQQPAAKLYSYDSGDVFIMGGENITMDKFEELLAERKDEDNVATLNIVRYNTDGESIFTVTQDNDPTNDTG